MIILIVSGFISPEFGYPQGQTANGRICLAKVVSFDPDSILCQPLLNGEKDSVAFYSGVVTLSPDQSGEIHNNEVYEEMIVPLEGEGQLKVTRQGTLTVKFGKIAFIPPHTEHQMVNMGKKNFKYIYIATKSKK